MEFGKYVYHGLINIDPSSSWDITELTTIDFGQLWPLIQTTMCIFHITEVKCKRSIVPNLHLWDLEFEGNIKGGYFNEMTIDSNDDVIITAHGQLKLLRH